MTIRAVLVVENNDPRDDQSEDRWGEFDFAELPSKGDEIVAERNFIDQVLEVCALRHFPVPYPLPKVSSPVPPREVPIVQIVAKWVRPL